MTDKDYCMSSYLAFRYIEDDNKDFYDGMKHKNISLIPDREKTFVKTADEIGEAINAQMRKFDGKKKDAIKRAKELQKEWKAEFFTITKL